jgi:hypothetical protein
MGLRSASSSSYHWRFSLSSVRRGAGCVLRRTSRRQWLYGEIKRALCEDGVFLLVARVGRGRGCCAEYCFLCFILI